MRILITGANRGIGLEFARRYLERGEEVAAAVRTPDAAEALSALTATGRLRVLACDVRSDSSVRDLAAAVGEGAIDILINNAGVREPRVPLAQLDYAEALRVFDTNALGPLRVTAALLPQLRRSQVRKVIHISSALASLADNKTGGSYGYRMAKAALNMACRSLAADLRDEGITTVVLNPGWVHTDMGGPHADLTLAQSVPPMLEVIDKLTLAQSGSFLDYQGNGWPW